MSHTRVKTTYNTMSEAGYAGSTVVSLYCHHNHGTDTTTFYWEDGSVATMVFEDWDEGNDLWDAMNRLWFPFTGEWGVELKDGVEYYFKAPWE